LSTSSEELGTRHQTPTLIGCIFLRNQKIRFLFSSQLAVISEALNSNRVFKVLSNFVVICLSTSNHPPTSTTTISCSTPDQRSLEFYTSFYHQRNFQPKLFSPTAFTTYPHHNPLRNRSNLSSEAR
ncbi:hypothetical protein, partial [Paracidovorax avenae]|uniref:hypothetical protein n=1 Tax=Paracidovorax avenae TaxID=80867 RepID=UPI001F162955